MANATRIETIFSRSTPGRGNNAYRWAGETDVWEAMLPFRGGLEGTIGGNSIPLTQNGSSSAGSRWAGRALGTWASVTRTAFVSSAPERDSPRRMVYIANLPKALPDYQEKCLRIYDAVDYVENAFDVPIVAYSGEIDAQKKAADNIENLLKNFKEPVSLPTS